MKLSALLALGLFACASGAQAAEVALAASYGDAAGCATHADGGGKAVRINPGDVRFEGSVCPYTGITEQGANVWQVKIACESGHEEVVRGTLLLTEKPAEKSLSVALVDGAGPKGDFTACDPAEAPKP